MVLQAEASYLDRGTFAVRLLPKFKEGDDEAKIVRGLQRIDELDLLLLEKTREGASPLPPRCALANPHPSTPSCVRPGPFTAVAAAMPGQSGR
jgi:hypothetical protein